MCHHVVVVDELKMVCYETRAYSVLCTSVVKMKSFFFSSPQDVAIHLPCLHKASLSVFLFKFFCGPRAVITKTTNKVSLECAKLTTAVVLSCFSEACQRRRRSSVQCLVYITLV